jgi:TupA-like ATPgrasp
LSRRLHPVGTFRFYWHLFKRRNDPTWQGHVVRPFIGWLAHRRMLSFDTLTQMEWSLRRLLGQPFTRREWGRMTFTDKVNYRRLRDHDPLHQLFCDKVRMRDYVTERLGSESVPKVLAVGQSAEELSGMVGPFFLKASHGSAMVIKVDEPRSLTAEEMRTADGWLTRDYSLGGLEWAYRDIPPVLLVEELLRNADGTAPIDYRFFAFHGQTKLMHVDTGPRDNRFRTLRHADWSLIPGTLLHPNPPDLEQSRPPNLEKMLELTEVLAREIDFVRVDFYDLGDRVLVGELTPYPSNGAARFRPSSLDAWLGMMWDGPPPKR